MISSPIGEAAVPAGEILRSNVVVAMVEAMVVAASTVMVSENWAKSRESMVRSAASTLVKVLPVALASNAIPVIVPVVEISQSEESIATVAELFPMVVTPVEDKVVKAPVEGVEAPRVVPSIAPPLMSTVAAVKVPESVSSPRVMPPSKRLSSVAESKVPSMLKTVSQPVPMRRAISVPAVAVILSMVIA